MFKVSVADLCLVGPLTSTSSRSLESSSRSQQQKQQYTPSLGTILQAVSDNHCTYQLPVDSADRQAMIQSLLLVDHTKLQQRQLQRHHTHGGSTMQGVDDSAIRTGTGPMIVDPYRVLQVRHDCTPQECRHAYKRLSLWHHPGRSVNCSNKERCRRRQVFEILAACYETLVDKESRRRCDALLKDEQLQEEQQQQTRFKGDVRVGQVGRNHQQQQAVDNNNSNILNHALLPDLSAASSESSLDGEELSQANTTQAKLPAAKSAPRKQKRHHHHMAPLHLLQCGLESLDLSTNNTNDDDQLPCVMNASSSTTAHTPVQHYSAAETNRLFGGPLQLLYRARRWMPFSDPFDVFARVFGSTVSLGHYLPVRDWNADADDTDNNSNVNAAASNAADVAALEAPAPKSAAWTGSSQTLADGTVIYTTCRTLNDRLMTRTETVKTDPATGRTHSFVSVTSHAVAPPPARTAVDDAAQEDSFCHSLEFCMFLHAERDDTAAQQDSWLACSVADCWLVNEDATVTAGDATGKVPPSRATVAASPWYSCEAPCQCLDSPRVEHDENPRIVGSVSPSRQACSKGGPQSWALCGQWLPE